MWSREREVRPMRYKPCTVLYSCTHGMGHPVCVFVVRERRIVRILLSTDTFTLSDLRCRCADAKNNERFKSFNHACTSRLILIMLSLPVCHRFWCPFLILIPRGGGLYHDGTGLPRRGNKPYSCTSFLPFVARVRTVGS